VTFVATVWRGVFAGLLAGLLAGLFALVVAEPTMDRAIALEEQRSAAAHPGEEHAEDPVFTRSEQKFGLTVTAPLVGGALGALFALTYAAARRRDPAPGQLPMRPWTQSLLLATGGFIALAALPFLRYPANPPGVGDPETVTTRTAAWLATIVIGLVALWLVVRVRHLLAARGSDRPILDLASGAIMVGAFLLILLLPDNRDPVEAPATLIWHFRLLALGMQAVLWAALGIIFGLLVERAVRSGAPPRQPATVG
jgi:predicted cobalt transporter CbtA